MSADVDAQLEEVHQEWDEARRTRAERVREKQAGANATCSIRTQGWSIPATTVVAERHRSPRWANDDASRYGSCGRVNGGTMVLVACQSYAPPSSTR